MNFQHLPVAQLGVSPLNVNFHRKKPYVGDLISSFKLRIKSNLDPVIMPLLVTKTPDDHYEVFAGRRRLLAAIECNIEQVPVFMFDSMNDAEAVEMSLLENVARQDMDPIDEYRAYSRLLNLGRSIEDIARGFDVDELQVKQRLAIAGLTKGVLTLFETGKINTTQLTQLTLASKKKQAEFVREHKKGNDIYNVKRWLYDDKSPISTEVAMFDLELYDGKLQEDLFEGKKYFAEPEKFWDLQNAAIDEAKQSAEKRGWTVEIVREQYWGPYKLHRVKKADGGAVYIHVRPQTGEVEIHQGYAKRKPRAKQNGTGETNETTPSAEKKELTNVSQQMVAALRLGMAQQTVNTKGMTGHYSLLLAMIVTSRWFRGHAIKSFQPGSAHDAYHNTPGAAEQLTRFDRINAEKLFDCSSAEAWAKLRKDATLLKIVEEYVIAGLLEAGDVLTEAVLQDNSANPVFIDVPDAFYESLRDKKVIVGMLKELGVKDSQKELLKCTVKALKARLAEERNSDELDAPFQPRYFEPVFEAYVRKNMALNLAAKAAAKTLK